MRAAILTTGTELTRGEIADTNAQWLAFELDLLGVEVAEIATVGDQLEAIATALTRLGGAVELVVVSGGLGPTTDDLTAAAAARALGVELVRDADSLDRIRARLARFGRELSPSNAKQADFPAGARVVPNDNGTAPGFHVRLGRAEAWFLPGVPRELRAMFAEALAPTVTVAPAARGAVVKIRTFGLGESAVNDRLAGLEAEHGITLGYRAHFPEVEVKVQARGGDAAAVARRAADAVTVRLGRGIAYAEGEASLAAVLGRRLVAAGQRLALAESCTGGLVGAWLTDQPGASDFLLGGVIAYANTAKTALLGVPPALLEAHGAVSPEVARAMARGAREALGADLALAITGVAGPGGGTAEKPVGRIELAVASGERVLSERLELAGDRGRVRTLAAWTAMALVLRVLDGDAP